MMTKVTLALAMTVSIAGLAAAQQDVAAVNNGSFTYTRFYRVHLRNGNTIDGDLIAKTDLQVTLKVSYGEIHIRRNMIDRIEYVKMKSWNDPEILIEKRKKSENPQEIASPVKASDPAVVAEAADSADAVPSNISLSIVESVDLTISAWKRTNPDDRPDLAQSLIALGAPAVPYLEFLLEKRPKSTPPEPVVNALASISEERFVDLCPKLVVSRSPMLRSAAVVALGKTNSSKRLVILVEAMEDDDPAVGTQAMEAVLGWAKSDDDKRDLADLLAGRIRKSKNNSPLATALSKLGGRAAHDALWDLVNDTNETNRVIGLQGVAMMADPEDGSRVQPLLRDPSITIKKQACLTIGRLKCLPAVPDLIHLLDDENEGLQHNARWALMHLITQPVADTSEAWKEWWTNYGSKQPQFNQ